MSTNSIDLRENTKLCVSIYFTVRGSNKIPQQTGGPPHKIKYQIY